MTGKGHRLTGLGAAFIAAAIAKIAGLDVFLQTVCALVAAVSTSLPDWIEIPYYRKGVRTGSLIKHRTYTHWPWIWVGLMYWGFSIKEIEGAAMIGAATGALSHILADAPNPMGIPWIHPLQRIRLGKKGWWRSGKNETVLVSLFTVFGVSIWVQVNPENVFAQGLTQLTQESVKQINLVLQPLVQNFITYLSSNVIF
ncbi:MAG: metal-dependent hydrolase [Advenella sp.]|nr:metal-dependent hydrolase [Advenella sp.]MDD3757413.1 metal-dependent hydrolase [Advenella sp.]